MTIEATGRKLIALGRAMLDESSSLEELNRLAMDAGLRVQFRIVATEAIETKADAPPEDRESRGA